MLMIMNYLIYAVKTSCRAGFRKSSFFDTRTWKIAEECDGGKMWGMNVETTGSGDVTPDSFWERTVFEKRVFKNNITCIRLLRQKSA